MKTLLICLIFSLSCVSCKKNQSGKPSHSMENRSLTPVANLSTECADRENCGSTECQEEIASYHEISQATFNTMISGFNSTGKAIRVESISSALDAPGISCKTHVIAISGDMEDGSGDNSDISFTVVSDSENSGYDIFTVNYPIALFRYILLQNPTSCNFYKATRPDCSTNCEDIVFTANFSGNVTKYYDMSEPPD